MRALRRGAWVAALTGAVVGGAVSGGVVAAARGGPPSARNVVICQGDAPPCETGGQVEGGGDEHLVTVMVTDAAGAPVGNVPVELREEGVGRFTTGADSVVVTTASDGRASAYVTSDEVGRSYVSAEIGPSGTPGGFRGPATHDDECEQPSGPGGDPPAGNCISGPLTVDWHIPPPDPPQCSDGIDNDGDGDVDYPEDPSCNDDLDDSEITSDPVTEVRVIRKVSLAFSDWRRDRVVVFGRVRNVTAGPRECSAGGPVAILRRSRTGRWVAKATVTTSDEGWYVVALPDRPGRYRASALRFKPRMVDGSYVTCTRAKVVKAHRHDA